MPTATQTAERSLPAPVEPIADVLSPQHEQTSRLLNGEDLDDPEQFHTVRRVPILDANDDEENGVVDEPLLNLIAHNSNKLVESGEYPVLTLGHLRPKKFHDELEQPPIVGVSSAFHVSQYNGRPCLYSDFHIHKDQLQYVRAFPHRSVERVSPPDGETNPDKNYVDRVALLRTPPRRPLGILKYQESDSAYKRVYYARNFPPLDMPSSYTPSLPNQDLSRSRTHDPMPGDRSNLDASREVVPSGAREVVPTSRAIVQGNVNPVVPDASRTIVNSGTSSGANTIVPDGVDTTNTNAVHASRPDPGLARDRPPGSNVSHDMPPAGQRPHDTAPSDIAWNISKPTVSTYESDEGSAPASDADDSSLDMSAYAKDDDMPEAPAADPAAPATADAGAGTPMPQMTIEDFFQGLTQVLVPAMAEALHQALMMEAQGAEGEQPNSDEAVAPVDDSAAEPAAPAAQYAAAETGPDPTADEPPVPAAAEAASPCARHMNEAAEPSATNVFIPGMAPGGPGNEEEKKKRIAYEANERRRMSEVATQQVVNQQVTDLLARVKQLEEDNEALIGNVMEERHAKRRLNYERELNAAVDDGISLDVEHELSKLTPETPDGYEKDHIEKEIRVFYGRSAPRSRQRIDVGVPELNGAAVNGNGHKGPKTKADTEKVFSLMRSKGLSGQSGYETAKRELGFMA